MKNLALLWRKEAGTKEKRRSPASDPIFSETFGAGHQRSARQNASRASPERVQGRFKKWKETKSDGGIGTVIGNDGNRSGGE